MWKLPAVLGVAALAAGAASASPAPIESRAAAVLELQAAIADEERALELLRKVPPRHETALQRIDTSAERLERIRDFLSRTPGAANAERALSGAVQNDGLARFALGWDPPNADAGEAIKRLQEALKVKRAALPAVRRALAGPAVAQCSDGKDNDGDGNRDWAQEPGCSSARDVRESSPFTCEVQSRVASGRLVLAGSCSGSFSEVEFRLLDDLQLNGRFDIMHAPSCAPTTTTTTVRCTTKSGAQNPGRLVEARFTTTRRTRGQRVRMRFFDQRKRQIRAYFVPVR